MTTLSLKIKFQNELRRVTANQTDLENFSNFEGFIKTLFQEDLPRNQPITITYKDSEGDDITLGSDLELEELLKNRNTQTMIGSQILRLEIFKDKRTSPIDPSTTGMIWQMLNGLKPSRTASHFPVSNAQKLKPETEDLFKKTTETGMKYAEEGMRYAEEGMKYAEEGMKYAEEGMKYAEEEGIKYAEEGMKYAENGIRSAGLGWCRPWGGRQRGLLNPQSNTHWGITCDGCGFRNIQGKRYFCLDCQSDRPYGVDFCESCFIDKEKMAQVHSRSHDLLEIESQNHDYAIPRGTRPWRAYFPDRIFSENFRKQKQQNDPPQSIAPTTENLKQNEPLQPRSQNQSQQSQAQDQSQQSQDQNQGHEQGIDIPAKFYDPIQTRFPFPTLDDRLTHTPLSRSPPSIPCMTKAVDIFEQKLNQLSEMGFTDKEKNSALLLQTKGDVTEVVKSLIKE